MPQTLTQRVVEVCDEAITHMSAGDGRDRVARVRTKLLEPLRVAIAGSVSSGKSTLVNALLGQHIAAVAAGESTRVVTWYRYHYQERAEVYLRSGERRILALEPGPRLPRSLGTDPNEVERVVVRLSNEQLEDLVIIDTPGLNSVSETSDATLEELLGVDRGSKEGPASHRAMSQADALIYLMPHLRQTDAEVLTRFQSLYRGTGLSAVNAVGVLSKIDKLASDGEEPWAPAQRIARRIAGELRSVVSTVVPVVGLLAETANGDEFNEDDARALRRLAALDEAERDQALLTGQDFLELPDVLPMTQRRRLLGMLDIYGLRVALRAIDEGSVGAVALSRALDRASGFGRLKSLVVDVFRRRADLLKAHAGMSELHRIAFLPAEEENEPHLRTLRNLLEQLELDERIQDLRVLGVFRQVSEGAFALEGTLLEDLQRLALESTLPARLGLGPAALPAEIAAAAIAGAARWGALANDTRRSPAENRMASEVKTSYELMYDAATRPPAS